MQQLRERQLIELKCGEWRAVIDVNNGANCIRLRNERYGAVLLREPPIEGIDNPYLYGMPILFPVNRIENGVFEFEGRRYVFPINEPSTGCHLHGELHQQPFELVRFHNNQITCRYLATNDRPYLSFPHEFEIIVEYEIGDDGFKQAVMVTNLSDQNMPLFLGFHTTFNTLFTKTSSPDDILVQADIVEEYERRMDSDYLPTGVRPAFDVVSLALVNGVYKPYEGKCSRHYRGQGSMVMTDVGNHLRLVYENDEKYGYRLIYNGGCEGYICLEPQNCLVNCANAPFSRSETGFDFLRAGESKIFRSRIFLEEL